VSRFFAFGCSFTNYNWPTWADIMGECFEYSENWGAVGAGNHFIHNALIECDIRNKITAEDVVAIMWTSVTREDRYRNGEWVSPGNIYTQDVYSDEYVKTWADTRGYYIRDLSFMYSAKKLLESIGCKFYFMSMVDLDNSGDHFDEIKADMSDLFTHYRDTLDIVKPSMHTVVFNRDWWSRPLLNLDQNIESVREKWYQIAGADWPEFESFISGSYVKSSKKSVIKEILDVSKWDLLDLIRRTRRYDLHPIPGEHLLYLNKVLPEYDISEKTQLLIGIADQQVKKRPKIFPKLPQDFKIIKITSRW
jgi:hypothetical protein